MINWSGERFILGKGSPEVHHEHLHRYELACLFANNRRVLDLGCGSGTGSAMLSAAGGAVSAMDIDPEAVAHAKRVYEGNADFAIGSATALPYDDSAFDIVTCFEVIEHLAEQAEVIDEISRVIVDSGLLFISTPMRAEYNKGLLKPNPFHVAEMEHEEFAQLLGARFPFISYLEQRSMTVSVMWMPASGDDLLIAAPPGVAEIRRMEPVYEVAVCSREPLPAIPGPSLFLDLSAQGETEPSLVTQVRDARIELTDADQRARWLLEHLRTLDARIAELTDGVAQDDD
jgi:SAM-dependent methyltransferase